MRLSLYIRGITGGIVRPIFAREECEHCGIDEDLHLHHEYPFNKILKDSLSNLGLDYHDKASDYTDEELDIIINQVLGMEMRVSYLTLCRDCHVKEHRIMTPTTRRYGTRKRGDTKTVPVYKVCTETHEVVEEFPAIIDAAESVGDNHSRQVIRAMDDIVHQYKGYYWSRVNEYNRDNYRLDIPVEYLDTPLTVDMKSKLIDEIGYSRTWRSLKPELLDIGYEIKDTQVRMDGKRPRVSIITECQ